HLIPSEINGADYSISYNVLLSLSKGGSSIECTSLVMMLRTRGMVNLVSSGLAWIVIDMRFIRAVTALGSEWQLRTSVLLAGGNIRLPQLEYPANWPSTTQQSPGRPHGAA